MHKDFWQGEITGISPDKSSSQSFPFGIDADTALIFSLIFILKKEKGDPILILALLYILT